MATATATKPATPATTAKAPPRLIPVRDHPDVVAAVRRLEELQAELVQAQGMAPASQRRVDAAMETGDKAKVDAAIEAHALAGLKSKAHVELAERAIRSQQQVINGAREKAAKELCSAAKPTYQQLAVALIEAMKAVNQAQVELRSYRDSLVSAAEGQTVSLPDIGLPPDFAIRLTGVVNDWAPVVTELTK